VNQTPVMADVPLTVCVGVVECASNEIRKQGHCGANAVATLPGWVGSAVPFTSTVTGQPGAVIAMLGTWT
jgi:hypothetical protein